MKRLLLSLILSALAGLVFADEGYMRLGSYLTAQQWHTDNASQSSIIDANYALGALFYGELNYKFIPFNGPFFAGGDVKTYMVKNKAGITFNPIYLDYQAFAGIRLSGFEIGYAHQCTHPQNVLEGVVSAMENRQTCNDQVYVQFSFNTK